MRPTMCSRARILRSWHPEPSPFRRSSTHARWWWCIGSVRSRIGFGKPFFFLSPYPRANLFAGRRVVPELIQESFTPEAVAAEALRVLTDPAHAARVRADLADVRTRL